MKSKKPSLGKNIIKRRIDRGLSQGKLAKRAGISQNYLSLIENDHAEPLLTTLKVIADKLKTTVSELTDLGE